MKTTLRKLLILTLSLALALSLATIAWGETTEYPIVIGSTPVTSDNAADVLDDGTVSYDAAANTLTLNGAAIVPTGNHGIRVQGDITIHLIGANTVTAGAGLIGIDVSPLTGEEPMLTITGEEGASLTVSGGHHGINVMGDLQISNTTVTAAGDLEYGIAAIDVTITDSRLTANGNYSGIDALAIAIDNSTVEVNGLTSRGLSIDNAATITNSTVTANGGEVGINASITTIDNSTVTATGISTWEAIVISGANTKVTASGETHGIVAIGDITITDGEVTATSGDVGIYAGGDITITASTVTATGNVGYGIFSESGIVISGANTKVTATGGSGGIQSNNALTIDGSEVTATGTERRGINCGGNIAIKNGTVTATGGFCGIYSVNVLTIDGSEVIATGTEYRGIDCGGNIVIKNGTVTAEGVQGIVASETITIHSSKVEATGTMDTAFVASDGVTISDSEVSATGRLNGISSNNGSITIDGSEVTATGTTQYGIIGDTVTITDSTVTTKGNGITGIESSTVTITASTVTATDNTYYGITGDTLTITASTVTATGSDRTGISVDNVTISNSTVTATGGSNGTGISGFDAVTITNSTVTAEGVECAIMTDLLNITNGNWYQWTGDDNEIMYSGIGTMDHPLTTEDAANNKYLKIEPIAFADYDHTLTFMNGEDVWHILGLDDGMMMGIMVGMPVPDAPESAPEGSVFFHWKDENDRRIYPTMTISGDMTIYATWAMPLEGTVTISGKAVVGKTLTATVNVTTPGVSDEDLTYQWLRGKGQDARPIMGAESATYTPTQDDVGKVLTCWVGSPDVAPGLISGETNTVRRSGGGGGSYYPSGSGEEPLVTSPNTFDSGIAASMVVTILAATGSAWLSKKKD